MESFSIFYCIDSSQVHMYVRNNKEEEEQVEMCQKMHNSNEGTMAVTINLSNTV